MSWQDDGTILIADVSEANVKRYSKDGRLRHVIGRRGRGPGEFLEPRYPVINGHHEIVVGEANGQLSYFDSTGMFVDRRLPLSGLGISSLSIRPTGNTVVTGWPTEAGVLAEYDSIGLELRRMIPMKRPPVGDSPGNPLWLSMSQYWQVLVQDTAFVFATLSDSVWIVDLSTGSIASHQLLIDGYLPPVLPERPLSPRDKEFATWRGSFHTAMGAVSATDGFVGISLVQGVLNYGDPALFVYRAPSGEWTALSAGPPVIAARPGEVLAIHRPESETVVLARYRMLAQ